MLSPPAFDLVVHADWGTDKRKRWMCGASPTDDGGYRVDAPVLVGDLDTFWQRLDARAGGPRILVGFDFPIGLPAAYAELAGIDDFKAALPAFGTGAWSAFYDLAERRDEISVHRPFYPFRPGGTRHAHLVEGLGIPEMKALLRRCERATATRGAASPLFWTLGGKQVGRAAIIGWRDVFAPVLRHEPGRFRVWPFDGDFAELASMDATVIAETYPAEACVHLGIGPPGRAWSKTSQGGRQAQAPPLLAWCRSRGVDLASELSELIQSGFGPASHGEDPFDAVVGLFGMLEVALGHRGAGAPSDRVVRRVEGWIFGQSEVSDGEEG